MNLMFSSIKIRLVVWLTFALSLVTSGIGIYLYYQLENIVTGSVDDHLHSEIQLIAGLLDVEGERDEAPLDEADTGQYAVPLSGHYYQVYWIDKGKTTYSPSLSKAGAKLAAAEKNYSPIYNTTTGPEGGPLRMLSQAFNLSSGSTVIIQAGDSLAGAYKLLSSFKKVTLIVFPTFILISCFSALVIIGWSFKPLDAFSEKVGHVTEKSLGERLAVEGVDRELEPLARNFNTMLERIEQSFIRQRQFLSDASHELRTPASVIKSLCEITLTRERDIHEYEDTLAKIEKKVNRMTALINRILNVSRLESEIFLSSKTAVDLKSILKDVVKALHPWAQGMGTDINLKGDNLTVWGDRDRLTEAFTNIVDNAVKYNKKGSVVKITLTGGSGMANVSVSDRGIGIPEEEQRKIFDRFYRVDKSRSLVEGSGLGLSIAKSIVEAHNGTIEIISTAGKGTSVVVRLPYIREDT